MAGGALLAALIHHTLATIGAKAMQAKLTAALMSTAVVLGTIYVLNMFGPTRGIVQKAING